ncbi:MAG: protein translocase subunit SecF [Nitrococcus sp.]|nr:protein translocase subunit SecF [Nitrococcus sp.]
MQILKRETHIDFIGQSRPAAILSALLILISVVSLAIQGLNFGLDFTGGTLVELHYPQPVELDGVRATLGEAGFPDAVAQYFGSAQDVVIRLAPEHGEAQQVSEQVLQALRTGGGNPELQRVVFVGPQVGEELTTKGGLAMLYAIIGILVYTAFRFEYRFAAGAILALIHDVVVTIGFFSVLQLEFDLTVLAAVLAIIGYSVNDTIVIFDRIRENFARLRKRTSVEIANISINQTLSRTLMTGGITLAVSVVLYVLGPELIAGFSLAMIVGVIAGAYSTVYIASAAALTLGISKADMMPPRKEGAEIEERV